ncbi:hypothetical protein N9980_00520 [bacterium]|nr:hypothetical protein [bacterium]
MATIASIIATVNGSQTVARTALTGADDLIVNAGVNQTLVLENTGVATPTINILGDQATTITCNGVGDPIDVSGGYDISMAAGEVVTLYIASISAFTNDSANTPAVTGGTADVVAYIIER